MAVDSVIGIDSAIGRLPDSVAEASLPFADVRRFGALPSASASTNRAALQDAIDHGLPMIPAGDYEIDAPLTIPSGGTVTGERGCILRQTTQLKPVFDLLNVDSVTISGFTLINDAGPPTSTGSSFRGDSGYLYSAGVWANGEHHTLTNLRIIDFAVGVYVNSSNGTTNVGDSVERIGNTIRDVEVSGCNHGVLFLNQTGLLIDGVYVHDHVDSSSGVNPTHGVYGTGDASNTSTDVKVSNCLDVGNDDGHAYQFKYINGLKLANLDARDAKGLINLQDTNDVKGANLSSIGDSVTTASFTSSFVTATNSRLNINDVSIVKAVDATEECRFTCADSRFSNFLLSTLKNGANINGSDVRIDGTKVTVDGFKLRNTGSSNARGFHMASGSDITISNFELDNYRNLVDIASGMTGLNVIDYAPFAQRNIAFGTGSYVKEVSGTPPFTVIRRETTITYNINGGNAWPLAGLETVSRFNVTSASAFTINPPQIGLRTGMIHEIAVHNSSGGALGTITWDATYVFASGSPPTAPADGATKNIRFMYNGSNWRECA